MFECVNCKEETLIWSSDFSYEDVGREGNGIVSYFHCSNDNCRAEIELSIPFDEEE